jgi:uncharacterized protein (DUF305 family)
METKPLLYGIIGFLIGGLLVSLAATTFSKPKADGMTMDDMVSSLQDKKSDAYDAAFVSEMIDHHQGAIDMAKLSEKQAKHKEVKDLSKAIIEAQEKEIAEMKKWQEKWGYDTDMSSGM